MLAICNSAKMKLFQLEEMFANNTRHFKIGFDTIKKKQVYLSVIGTDIMATEVSLIMIAAL